MTVIDQNTAQERRLPAFIVGENVPKTWSGTLEYIALIPSDVELSQREVMRRYVTDVLVRNGQPATANFVDKMVGDLERDGLDFDGTTQGNNTAALREWGGPTDKDGKPGPNISGYGATLTKSFQESVLSQSLELQGPSLGDSPESTQRMLDLVTAMKLAAAGSGNGDAKEALEAIETMINAKKFAQENPGNSEAIKALDGAAVGVATIKSVVEFLDRTGMDERAAELLGRMTSSFSLPVEVAKFGESAYKTYTGVDPRTGKPLSESQRIDAGIDMLENGLGASISAGKIAGIFGVTSAETVAGAVALPATILVVELKMMKAVHDERIKALNAIGEEQFSARFPLHDDSSSTKKNQSEARYNTIIRRAEEMPVGEGNAHSTISRILDTFKNTETRERFVEFIKQRTNLDNAVDAINDGKHPQIGKAQMSELAAFMKQKVRPFMDAEIADQKVCVVGHGLGILKVMPAPGEYLKEGIKPGEKTLYVGTPLHTPQVPESNTNNTLMPEKQDLLKKIVDQLDKVPAQQSFFSDKEAHSPGAASTIAIPKHQLSDNSALSDGVSHQLLNDARYLKRDVVSESMSRMAKQIFENDPYLKSLGSDESNRNLSSALTLAAVKQNFEDVSRVMLNKDGTRLIAVQGDERSDACKTASVVIQDAIKQPAQESLAQIAQIHTDKAAGAVRPPTDIDTIAVKPQQIENETRAALRLA